MAKEYPATQHLIDLTKELRNYAELKHEHGSKNIDSIIRKFEKDARSAIQRLKALPIDGALSKKEPNKYSDILALRPKGTRRLWKTLDRVAYRDKLEGAFLGRCAGNTLGAVVEFWTPDRIERVAQENGQAFPPDQHWKKVPDPFEKRFADLTRASYSIEKMNGVPTDDDLAYTELGLLIAEAYGPDFTTQEVGKAWVQYLPFACTAEDVALKGLKKGISALKVAEVNNPYCEWIGADIRSDPWAYMAPGWPEKAAAMAYRDAYLSHRRQGIYGEMYFSAAIAAAFAVQDPVEALRLGLNEIPRHCTLAREIRWALSAAPKIKNHKDARAAVEKRYTRGELTGNYAGMHPVHTINNACLTVWGITIGKTDFSRVIGETVAMGMDNDCTAATAGSIVGAVVGRKGIPKHWHRQFNNTIHSYLNGIASFKIDDLYRRFTAIAVKIADGN